MGAVDLAIDLVTGEEGERGGERGRGGGGGLSRVWMTTGGGLTAGGAIAETVPAQAKIHEKPVMRAAADFVRIVTSVLLQVSEHIRNFSDLHPSQQAPNEHHHQRRCERADALKGRVRDRCWQPSTLLSLLQFHLRNMYLVPRSRTTPHPLCARRNTR